MELKRQVSGRMCFALLILGNIATAFALSGVNKDIGQNLDCTNDLDKLMSCDFEAQNCTEYNLTLKSDSGFGEVHCIFKQCDSGRCCCSTRMILVLRETHTARVWKGGESIGSKIIRVTDSIKPRVPTITSVKESNGNFQLMWKTNMEGSLGDSLKANVTYHKKGDTKKVSTFVKPTTVDGLNHYEILGRHLEPSTTYAVSVKSYTNWSGLFSDSSQEWEFTTPASPYTLISAVIATLSITAVIISGAVYGCYVKFKTKWWDSVAKCPNPKLLNMLPSQQEVLKPVLPVISAISVEPLIPSDSSSCSKGSLRDISSGSPQQSSGISTGSSCLSYANTEPADIIAGVQDAVGKALGNISPRSPLTTNTLTELNTASGLFSSPHNLCDVRADAMSFGSSGFDNKTYSIHIPSFLHQITADGSEVQTQAEMLCDSAYRPSECDVVICADQQVPACLLVTLPPADSFLMPTDMSYQQCNANSGRFSYAEDSGLSSISSGTIKVTSCDPVSRVEVDCESSDATKLNGKTQEASICDENPCYSCVPAGSHSFPPVDDGYQAFQNLVGQPDILFSDERSGEEEEHLNKYPEESFTKMPESFFSPVVPGFISPLVQGGQCLSELQRPFLSLNSADQSMPVITDSGYQSV